MELVTKKRLHLFTGRANPALAHEISQHLGIELGDPGLIDFANGEIKCRFEESVRGGDVFIIQSHAATEGMSVNDAIMEHLIMVDAARRASAKRITAVAPFYGYARQDRKAQGREPITARLVSDLLRQAGADRLVSIDLHSGQIQGFFEGPVDHLTAAPVLIDHLRSFIPQGSVIVSPDTGRVKVAERYAKRLDCEVATIYKRRSLQSANEVEALGVMGDVDGRTCVIIDDMVDTAGTICSAVDTLVGGGASDVLCATTHAVFSGPAIDRLKNSALSRVIVTDTVPLPDSKRFDKLEVLSAAGILADALESVFEDTSVSEIFDGENHS
ncbi:MAG: ribose-phosphate diphosphokinase [Acidimicrobiales bacterium]|jgi:ribose-phosphate pyrophosphokinase|nr:ribose-phosphate diphosphokinase [Acidimicrobiales bacterium]|tara:strand:- start:699 stop:1682 length:984 start_codon:yes stop_codon:yes gene_type:complete